jgi:hypothetical protein
MKNFWKKDMFLLFEQNAIAAPHSHTRTYIQRYEVTYHKNTLSLAKTFSSTQVVLALRNVC